MYFTMYLSGGGEADEMRWWLRDEAWHRRVSHLVTGSRGLRLLAVVERWIGVHLNRRSRALAMLRESLLAGA